MPSNIFFPMSDEGYRITEDLDDYELTLGHKFCAFYNSTVSGTAGTSVVSITPNGSKICYAWFSIEVDKAGLYELYEDSEVSGGTIIVGINNNRNSTLDSDCVVRSDPTVTTAGSFIGAHIIGSVTGGASKSGGSSSVNKYQLKQSTSYIVRFTADSDNTRATQGIYWREVDA